MRLFSDLFCTFNLSFTFFFFSFFCLLRLSLGLSCINFIHCAKLTRNHKSWLAVNLPKKKCVGSVRLDAVENTLHVNSAFVHLYFYCRCVVREVISVPCKMYEMWIIFLPFAKITPSKHTLSLFMYYRSIVFSLIQVSPNFSAIVISMRYRGISTRWLSHPLPAPEGVDLELAGEAREEKGAVSYVKLVFLACIWLSK